MAKVAGTGVAVGLGIGVAVGFGVGVAVGLGVEVGFGVAVAVGLGVGVAGDSELTALAKFSRPLLTHSPLRAGAL